ncbi:MAG: PAS domain-containing protein [Thermomicrobiales bacterium]|nr:PAS domain-containing protein [Thermomicrobiales bacterium]
MARLIRDHDWATTPMGPIDGWPQSVRTALDVMFGLRQPVVIAWGPAFTSLYNDGFTPILGDKHPNALGLPIAEAWAELWDALQPHVEAMTAGRTHHIIDLPVSLAGYAGNPTDRFAVSMTPLRVEEGTVVGFFCAVTASTEAVLPQDARLRLALDLAELGTWSWDLETGEGELDVRGAEIVGLPSGNLADVANAQIASIHPDDIARTMADVTAGIERGSSFNLSYRVNHPDGTIHHVASRARVVTDASGRPVRLIGTNRDVTAERESEATLRESEARFRALVRASSDAIYRMSPDWSEMRQLEDRTGLVDTGEPDRDWLRTDVHPDDRDEVLAAIATAIRTKSVVQIEHRVLRADGSTGWTFTRAVPILDRAGDIVEWFGAASDVTERKRTDAALRVARDEAERRKRLYETVTSSTPDLIYVFDRDYRFTYANEALLAMWGRTWEESIGQGLLALGYEPWHAEMHEREIDQVVATKQPIRGEVSFPHATLGRRIYDYIFSPVLDAAGNVEAVAGTTRDITELRQLAQQKDEFIGIVSHELRTPVTSIKAYAQLLHRRFRTAEDTTSAAMVAKMDAQLNRLTNLIGDLLDVTKIEAGQLQFRDERFEIDDLIDEVIEEIQHTADRHRIVREGRTGTRIWGDRERIGQVLTNLLSNAIKYSPQANSVIVRSATEAGQVTVAVQDFGVGIAAENRERVFERFYRVSGLADDPFPGIGLGLYITAEIVRRQGGRIWVESERGSGATFCFTLPIGDDEPGVPAQERR